MQANCCKFSSHESNPLTARSIALALIQTGAQYPAVFGAWRTAWRALRSLSFDPEPLPVPLAACGADARRGLPDYGGT